MKKLKLVAIAAIAAGCAACITSCSNKNKEAEADTSNIETEEVEVATDSVAALFRNPDYQSETATDSTYVVTPSGLKYMVEKEGTGEKPGPEASVTVHYTGKLLDGTIFDSSVQRGEPATFPLQGVIAGWTEGLQYMKEGSKYIFYIPTDLAYGEKGAPGVIPPYSDLIFEVELIKVNPNE